MQARVEEELAKLPFRLGAELIAKKMEAAGVTLTKDDHERLHRQLVSGQLEEFTVDDSQLRADAAPLDSIDVTFTDSEYSDLVERYERIASAALKDAAAAAVKHGQVIAARLREEWALEARAPERDRRSFARHLMKVWRDPIELLSMLITMCRDFGHQLIQYVPPSRRSGARVLRLFGDSVARHEVCAVRPKTE